MKRARAPQVTLSEQQRRSVARTKDKFCYSSAASFSPILTHFAPKCTKFGKYVKAGEKLNLFKTVQMCVLMKPSNRPRAL